MIFSRTTLFIAIFCFLCACSNTDAVASAAEPDYKMEAENMETANYATEENYAYDTDQSAPITRQDQAPTPPGGSTYQQQERVLIQRAESRIEVEKMSEKMRRIEQLLSFYGGYLADMNTQQMSYRNEVVMSLRIPAERFRPMLDSLRGMAVRVEQENIHAEDVTEEYVDLQTRLKTKKQVRDRYEDILRTKAKTVEEVLLAEEKIRRLQEEIEAQEGRLRYLANRSTLSQIQLSMYENIDQLIVADGPAWYANFLDDTKSALGFGFGMVKNIFLAILGLWPILLIVFWLIYKRKRIRAFFSPTYEAGKTSSKE